MGYLFICVSDLKGGSVLQAGMYEPDKTFPVSRSGWKERRKGDKQLNTCLMPGTVADTFQYIILLTYAISWCTNIYTQI